MPVKSFNSKADFDAAYNLNGEPDGHPSTRPGIRVNYTRAGMMPYAEYTASKLVELFAWPTSRRIMIVGSGYGWVAEVLEQQYGYTSIVCVDTSPYIQSTQDTSEEAEIDAAITAVGLNPNSGEGAQKKAKLFTPGNRRRHSRAVMNENLSNNGSRNRVKNQLGDIDTGITEEVITTLTNTEVVTLASQIAQVNPAMQVIHLTTERLPNNNQDPSYNWKSLAEWKALVPANTFVSLNTWQVL